MQGGFGLHEMRCDLQGVTSRRVASEACFSFREKLLGSQYVKLGERLVEYVKANSSRMTFKEVVAEAQKMAESAGRKN